MTLTPDRLAELRKRFAGPYTAHDMRTHYDGCDDTHVSCALVAVIDSHEALARQRDSYRDAFETYGYHDESCPAHVSRPCNCGYTEASRALAGEGNT